MGLKSDRVARRPAAAVVLSSPRLLASRQLSAAVCVCLSSLSPCMSVTCVCASDRALHAFGEPPGPLRRHQLQVRRRGGNSQPHSSSSSSVVEASRHLQGSVIVTGMAVGQHHGADAGGDADGRGVWVSVWWASSCCSWMWTGTGRSMSWGPAASTSTTRQDRGWLLTTGCH